MSQKDTVEVVIKATDEYSSTMDKFNDSVKGLTSNSEHAKNAVSSLMEAFGLGELRSKLEHLNDMKESIKGIADNLKAASANGGKFMKMLGKFALPGGLALAGVAGAGMLRNAGAAAIEERERKRKEREAGRNKDVEELAKEAEATRAAQERQRAVNRNVRNVMAGDLSKQSPEKVAKAFEDEIRRLFPKGLIEGYKEGGAFRIGDDTKLGTLDQLNEVLAKVEKATYAQKQIDKYGFHAAKGMHADGEIEKERAITLKDLRMSLEKTKEIAGGSDEHKELFMATKAIEMTWEAVKEGVEINKQLGIPQSRWQGSEWMLENKPDLVAQRMMKWHRENLTKGREQTVATVKEMQRIATEARVEIEKTRTRTLESRATEKASKSLPAFMQEMIKVANLSPERRKELEQADKERKMDQLSKAESDRVAAEKRRRRPPVDMDHIFRGMFFKEALNPSSQAKQTSDL